VACIVTVTNPTASPAKVKVGLVPGPRTAVNFSSFEPDLRDAVVTSEVEVPGGSTKKFFLYLPPQANNVFAFTWEAPGVEPPPPSRLDLGTSPWMQCLVLGRRTEAEKIASGLPDTLRTSATRPTDLPDRPEGYAQFHTIILHDMDLAILPGEVRTALRDWIVRGGLLVYSPGRAPPRGPDPVLGGVFPFRYGQKLARRKVTAMGALDPEAGVVPVEVYDLTGGEILLKSRDGTPMIRGTKAGLGACLASSTSLEILKGMTPGGKLWFCKNILMYLSKNETQYGRFRRMGMAVYNRPRRPGPGKVLKEQAGDGRMNSDPGFGPTMCSAPCFRHFLTFKDPMTGNVDSGFMETPTGEYLVLMLSNVIGTPGIGVIALYLIAFIAVVGPLNYWFLKKRGISALSALTVPLISLAFLALAIGMGLVTKGGTRANRIVIVEARSGQNWAVATALTYIRTGAGGDYCIEAGPGQFPVPELWQPPTYRLEETGVDTLVLPLDRWVVSGFEAESAFRLPGAVEAAMEGESLVVSNGLPLTLEGGIVFRAPNLGLNGAPSWTLQGGLEVFALGMRVAPGETRRFERGFVQPGQLSDDDKILLSLLQQQQSQLNRSGFACWIEHPFPSSNLNGEKLEVLGDRTALIIPMELIKPPLPPGPVGGASGKGSGKKREGPGENEERDEKGKDGKKREGER
jgi:hypothetical protein